MRREASQDTDVSLLVSPEPEQVTGLSGKLTESETPLVHHERLDSAPKKGRGFVG